MKRILHFIIGASVLMIGGCQPSPSPEAPPVAKKQIRNSDIMTRLKWLVKAEELYDQFEVNEMGIAMYASAGAMDSGIVECRIYPDEYNLTLALMDALSIDSMLSLYLAKGSGRWEQVITPIEPPFDEKPLESIEGPLSDWRIAIDPGHISDNLEDAELEGKYVKMKASRLTDGQKIGFFEPELTLATAYIIQDSLEKLGAKVILTRPYSGKGVKGKSFEEWLADDWKNLQKQYAKEFNWDRKEVNYWKNKADRKEIFKKMYNDEDLRARAEKVNEFRPDLTLIIHYNIHSPNWDKRDKNGFFRPTEANYCMAFIPGSFAKGELGTAKDRLHFLRLILSDDLEKSHELGKAFMKNSLTYTQVPAVPDDFPLPYLEHFSLLVEPDGLYARNLSLTRKIWGPLVYGESLCQDNVKEALRLNTKDRAIKGIAYSSRLDEVADAYLASVMDYVRLHKKTSPDTP